MYMFVAKTKALISCAIIAQLISALHIRICKMADFLNMRLIFYDRFSEENHKNGEAVNVNDINITQGVTEIEVTGQTITVDREMDSEVAVTTDKDTDENGFIEVQGGYKEQKHSLKDHPNIRLMQKVYQIANTLMVFYPPPHTHTRAYGESYFYSSLVVRKPVFGVSDQVRHKPGCTATEYG